MRYIKTYKIFESNVDYYKPILDTVKDILQDCEDMGLDVILFKDDTGVYDDPTILTKYNISLAKDGDPIEEVEVVRVLIEHNPSEYSTVSFKFRDIKDNVNHLIEYMKQLGYNDYLYQDQYTEFNYPRFRGIAATPNILPDDNDTIAVIKMVFYKD